MKKVKLIPAIIVFSLFCLYTSAQTKPANKNSNLDSLKKAVNDLGTVFKKKHATLIKVSGLASADPDFVALRSNIKTIVGVKQTETADSPGIVLLTVTYKGNAKNLWEAINAKVKTPFGYTATDEYTISLKFTGDPNRSSLTKVAASTKQDTQTKTVASTSKTTAAGDLSAGAALLFKDVKCKLSNKEKNAIYDSLQVQLTPDKTAFTFGEDTGSPFMAQVSIEDLNKDGGEDVFIVFGNSYSSGMTGSSIALFIKNTKGIYTTHLGFPAADYTMLKTKHLGYPDLQFGGPGFEAPVWKWTGKTYDYYKTVKVN